MANSAPLAILVLNQDWFVQTLRDRGHRVVSAGWISENLDVRYKFPSTPIKEVFAKLPTGFVPDRILYLDDSGPLAVTGLGEIDIPTVFYSVDAHHHSWWHSCFCAVFDKTLVAQKNYIESLSEYSDGVEWLPLWAPIQVEPASQLDIDVCFRGNLDPHLHPKRAKFFEELGRLTNLDAKTGRYVEAFPRSKIVVNQSVKDDLNFRVFEAMMCGTLLLTPRMDNGLLELFEDGVHLVTYEDGNACDAAEKCNYFLEHEQERAKIAAAGRARVCQKHTEAARAVELEQYLQSVRITERPLRCFGEGSAYYTSSSTIRRVSDVMADRLLDEAAQMLIRSAERREIITNAFMTSVHFCKYEYELGGQHQKAIELMRSLLAQLPDQILLGLSLIESLLRADRRTEALEVARQFGGNEEQLLSQVDQTLAPFRAEIVNQLQAAEEKRSQRRNQGS